MCRATTPTQNSMQACRLVNQLTTFVMMVKTVVYCKAVMVDMTATNCLEQKHHINTVKCIAIHTLFLILMSSKETNTTLAQGYLHKPVCLEFSYLISHQPQRHSTLSCNAGSNLCKCYREAKPFSVSSGFITRRC